MNESISKLSTSLFILVITTVIFSFIQVSIVFHSDLPISLQINGEVWTRKLSELLPFDRAVVFFICELSTFAWFSALYQMWNLGTLYKKGYYFTQRNSNCFIKIAFSLKLMAILNMLTVPLVGWYLRRQSVIQLYPDIDFSIFFGETDLIIAGVFFFLIGKIMKIANSMNEEINMTI